jgi:hypothetical protein
MTRSTWIRTITTAGLVLAAAALGTLPAHAQG